MHFVGALRRFTFASSTLLIIIAGSMLHAQAEPNQGTTSLTPREKMLLDRIDQLERRVAELEKREGKAGIARAPDVERPGPDTVARRSDVVAQTPANSSTSHPSPPASYPWLPEGATLNLYFDGYYEYDFNHPASRNTQLRFNDITANAFALNQADLVLERLPDSVAGRRLGYRFDLMFGQSTSVAQGSPVNEPHPDFYRNIYQAYGSYVLPIGKGLQADFGKFASSLGVESNYSKDQLNYSRSYWFTFLPTYHMGLRATYNLSDCAALQYWLVNGLNQTGDFNHFKSQAFITTWKPSANVSWNVNYYVGREQPDISLNPTLTLHPNGRTHIVDSYATVALNPKWLLVAEGDYVLTRRFSYSHPQLLYGGAVYLKREFTKTLSLATRFEYMKDRDGLFSATPQDLKETTWTATYQPRDGFQTKLEYRHDFTNIPYFATANASLLRRTQDSATVAVIWWLGGKQGIW